MTIAFVIQYTTAGLFHVMSAERLPPSRARPLTVLPDITGEVIDGLEVRSMLIAAPRLLANVLPVSVGLLVLILSPAVCELRITLLVSVSGALLRTMAAATPAP